MGLVWCWDLSYGAIGAIGAIQWGQWGQWWLDLSYGAIGLFMAHGAYPTTTLPTNLASIGLWGL